MEPVRERALQLYQLDPAVLEPVLTGHDIHLDQPQAFMRELQWFLMNIKMSELQRYIVKKEK